MSSNRRFGSGEEWVGVGSLPLRMRRVSSDSISNLLLWVAATSLFGRVPRGERVRDPVPQNYGENVTMLGAFKQTSATDFTFTVTRDELIDMQINACGDAEFRLPLPAVSDPAARELEIGAHDDDAA